MGRQAAHIQAVHMVVVHMVAVRMVAVRMVVVHSLAVVHLFVHMLGFVVLLLKSSNFYCSDFKEFPFFVQLRQPFSF